MRVTKKALTGVSAFYAVYVRLAYSATILPCITPKCPGKLQI